MPLMWPKGLGFRVLNLITNNIFLDRSLNYLLIYVNFIDQIIENLNKHRDLRKKVLRPESSTLIVNGPKEHSISVN